jgi:hypothetical protein
MKNLRTGFTEAEENAPKFGLFRSSARNSNICSAKSYLGKRFFTADFVMRFRQKLAKLGRGGAVR